ncbi:hypothetical protein Bpro_4172 [Polaromonas sp. JS666]|nr:hypothetical protein Bpro_4172 [Polaromonas sp. JS666]
MSLCRRAAEPGHTGRIGRTGRTRRTMAEAKAPVNYRRVRLYHWGMKTTYILGAILACSVTGTLVGARSAKTALLVVSAVLSLYGLVRLLG